MRDNAPADGDAAVVRHATAAGMVTLGKVTLPEFAFSAMGQNPHFGTPVNPLDRTTRRATGGSSSSAPPPRSRAGLAPCGLGSDTNGSVRIPAAFCGLVGLKTTEKRISTDRTFVLSHTLDTLGPIARTVEDCALLDAVWRGAAPAFTPRPAGTAEDRGSERRQQRLRRGGRRHPGQLPRAALDALRAAGAALETRPLPLFEEIRALHRAHGTLLAAESYFNLRHLLEGPERGAIDPRVGERALLGREMSAADLLTVQTARERMIAAFAEQVAGHAGVALPTTAICAPAWEAIAADVEAFRAATAQGQQEHHARQLPARLRDHPCPPERRPTACPRR